MRVVKDVLEFEWDEGNSEKPKKHGLTRTETEEAFFDDNKVIFTDWKHSAKEQRITLLGKTKRGQLLNIAYTIRKFKNEDEEAEFWDSIDLSEYLEPSDFEKVSFPNLKPTTRSISIRIPEYLLNRVKEKANEINIPYQSLIKEYIKKGVLSSG